MLADMLFRFGYFRYLIKLVRLPLFAGEGM